MKIAIVGAGGVGGVIAARLLNRGQHEISILARGAHLTQIRENGLHLIAGERRLISWPRASHDPTELGEQDIVLVATKAHDLTALAPRLIALMHRHTVILGVQNGIPWWYFYGVDEDTASTPFETVDPGGVLWGNVGPQRVLGGVIYLGAKIVEPGVVQQLGDSLQLTLGAPRAQDHDAILGALSAICNDAGISTVVTPQIRHAIWRKEQLFIANGPSSVLAGASVGQLEHGVGMRSVRRRLMQECLSVARAWGVELPDDIDQRLVPSVGLARHRTSMLQDYESGRRLELDATVTAVVDLAQRREVPVPSLETVWALAKLRESVRDEMRGLT